MTTQASAVSSSLGVHPCSAIAFDETRSLNAATARANECLKTKTAQERVAWALDKLPAVHILSSSFGAQAAVCLHLLTQQQSDIPVVFLDTGYLFPETYQFTDQLQRRLKLNLRVFRPARSPAWQEARNGQRWSRGLDGIESYNRENKVEPMQRALGELGVGTWFSGIRRVQSSGRQQRSFVERRGDVWKIHPILDWTDRDVHQYLKEFDLPYHPLWEKGYVSIGDVHTTRSIHEVEDREQTRFFGLKRECGIHDIGTLSKES